MHHSPAILTDGTQPREVPEHLFGTRAALFYLWSPVEGLRLARNKISAPFRAATAELRAELTARQNRVQEALLTDVFIF